MQTQQLYIPPKGLKGTRGKCEHSEQVELLTFKDFKNNPNIQSVRCTACAHYWYQGKKTAEEAAEYKKQKARETMRNIYWERKTGGPPPQASSTSTSSHRKKQLLPKDEVEYQRLVREGTDEKTLKNFRQRALYRLRKTSSSTSNSEDSDSLETSSPLVRY